MMIITTTVFQSCTHAIVRGAFGEVRLAFVKGSCEKVAVKVIEKKSFTAATITETVSFSSFLGHLNSGNGSSGNGSGSGSSVVVVSAVIVVEVAAAAT